MSTFTVPITVSPAEDGPKERLEAWVDTGSLYSWVANDTLERLGIRRHDTRRFTLANGKKVDLPIGHAWITIDEHTTPTIVVFGEEGSQTLLGAYALEGLALAADPVNEQLVQVAQINAFSSLE